MNRGVKLNISGDGYDGTSKRKSVKRKAYWHTIYQNSSY